MADAKTIGDMFRVKVCSNKDYDNLNNFARFIAYEKPLLGYNHNQARAALYRIKDGILYDSGSSLSRQEGRLKDIANFLYLLDLGQHEEIIRLLIEFEPRFVYPPQNWPYKDVKAAGKAKARGLERRMEKSTS